MKYIVLLFFFISGWNAYGQCGLDKSVTISDMDNLQADTTAVSILVSGASFNDLSTDDQGLCGVVLSFRHPFVQELFIEIISPAGQKITLVGGDIELTNTPLIRWNVTFIPCAAVPAPDAGFLPQWENNQPWQNLTTYTGQYHPYSGCLEDINIGSVNGLWTIRCIDFEDEGVGILLDARLIFCQNQGVSCSDCLLNPGSIVNQDILACRGDESLIFNIEKQYDGISKDTTRYYYSNIVIKDSTVMGYGDFFDFTSYDQGTYHICAIQSAKDQTHLLPEAGANYDVNTLRQFLLTSGACLGLSQHCMEIIISIPPEIVRLNKTICKGDTLVINEQLFFDDGQYFIKIDKNGCDSLIQLDLKVADVKGMITAETDSIPCNNTPVILNSLYNATDFANVQFTWFTYNGNIESDPTNSNITVSSSGTYYLSIGGAAGDNICRDTVVKEIFSVVWVPDIALSADTISCFNDTIKIKILNVNNDFNYLWNGPGLLQNNVAEPFVNQPGIYAVTVTNVETGCEVIENIEIIDARSIITGEFIIPELDCINDSIHITLLNADIVSAVYTGPMEYFSDALSPVVRVAGIYQFTIVNTENCKTTGSFEVKSNVIRPALDKVFLPFGCNQDSVLVEGTSSMDGTQFFWVGPMGFAKTGSNIFVYEGGEYMLTGVGPNGCKDSIAFVIGYDTLAPEIQILPHDTLSCKNPALRLQTSYHPPGSIIKWYPDNIVSDDLEVMDPGIYVVEITGNNNCVNRDSTIVLSKEVLPTFSASASEITCRSMASAVNIIPGNSSDIIKWENKINPVFVDDGVFNFSTSFIGTYTFTIENEEGCIVEGQISVEQDITKPVVLDIILDTLDCNQKTIDIGVITLDDPLELLWNGPGINDLIASGLLTVNKEGLYFLKITGKNYCVTSVVFDVVKGDEGPDFELFSDTITCQGSPFYIGVTSGSELTAYQWDGPGGFSSNVKSPAIFEPGMYSVTVTGINGCTNTGSVIVLGDTLRPLITMADTLYLNCNTGSLVLYVSADTLISGYIWTFPSGEISREKNPIATNSGVYSVQVTGANGCLSNKKVFQIQPGGLSGTLTIQADTITCLHPSATLSALSGDIGASFTWKSPSGNVTKGAHVVTSEAGIFELVVSNQVQCTDTLEVLVISDTMPPLLDYKVTGEIQCLKNDVIIDAGTSDKNNTIMTWKKDGAVLSSGNTYFIKPKEEGLFNATLLNIKNGCTSESEILITSTPPFFTEIGIEVSNPPCAEINTGSITLTNFNGHPPYNVYLNGIPKNNQLKYLDLSPGNYTLEVIDNYGCKVVKEIPISPVSDIIFNVQTPLEILFGDSILLKPEISGVSPEDVTLKWVSGDKVICEDCLEWMARPYINTVYTVELSVGGFCKRKSNILVKVKNDIEKAIPNIFSPISTNGNRIFYIPQIRGIEMIKSMKIFDRWAENVFNINNILPGDPTVGWNGQFNGKDVQTGVYIVFIELVLADGSIWSYKGDLTVLR